MSPAVCESRLPSAAFVLDGLGGGGGGVRCGDMAASTATASIDQWLAQQEAAIQEEAAEKKDGQLDIWASIESSKKADADTPPYVHPLIRRSASSLSQKSLEICTESLGSETGSDGVLSSDDPEPEDCLPWPAAYEEFMTNSDLAKEETEQPHHEAEETEHAELLLPTPQRRKEMVAVNYHCSVSRRSPPRTFPPPLPSLSRRDGPCLSMRPHRRDGRLVVEAVSVPSQNYLHAQRQDGRLLLTLVETTFQEVYPKREEPATLHLHLRQQADADRVEAKEVDRGWPEDDDDTDNDAVTDDEEMEEEEEEEEEEEGEEEVEVVDRGIVVEVNVSRPPQPQSGGLKVQRSSVVINKFVGAAMGGELAATAAATPPQLAPKNITNATTTTTATAVVAAAAAASSSLSTDERYWRYGTGPQSAQRPPSPEKLFFTSKRMMNRQDLLHQVRRCSEHLRPLFIWEPCCIATS